MSDNVIMQASDVISAKLAKAYVTVDGNRYLLFQAKDLETSMEKTKKTVDILGTMVQGIKSTGLRYKGTMTIYDNTEIFRDMMLKLAETGVDTYFDIMVENEDPTSQAGGSITILERCNIDKATLVSFKADGNFLEDKISFTFEKVKRPKKYKMLDGMKA